jgi:hypothetical protein
MSGLIFGFSYSLSYTCARTLSTLYGYDALHTGLVLLSGGAGEFLARVCITTLHISLWLQAVCLVVPLGADGLIGC